MKVFTVPTDVKIIYQMINTMGIKPDKRKLFLNLINFNLPKQRFTMRQLVQELGLNKYQYYRLNDYRNKKCKEEVSYYAQVRSRSLDL